MVVCVDGSSTKFICTLSKFVGEEISFVWVYQDYFCGDITSCMCQWILHRVHLFIEYACGWDFFLYIGISGQSLRGCHMWLFKVLGCLLINPFCCSIYLYDPSQHFEMNQLSFLFTITFFSSTLAFYPFFSLSLVFFSFYLYIIILT